MHHRHGGGRGGRHGKRLFDYGELRLLILAMIADKPSHGYELIKDIEERFGGVYVPSPGVIYPTLSWLEDMGYAAVVAEAGGRKRFSITSEGAAFLVANRQSADSLLERIGAARREDGRQHLPEGVLVAMKGFKHALRQRLDKGPIGPEEAIRIIAALDAARTIVEQDI
jgi:DNA-binding PadR family transcriptional regulator